MTGEPAIRTSIFEFGVRANDDAPIDLKGLIHVEPVERPLDEQVIERELLSVVRKFLERFDPFERLTQELIGPSLPK